MKRVISVLVCIVALFVFAQRVKPRLTSSPADSLGEIRTLSQKVLQPLESETSISRDDAQKALTRLSAKVAAAPARPDSARATQALKIIQQALDERTACVTRARSGSARSGLDKIPGKWHEVGYPEKSVDPGKISRQEKSSFWAQTIIKQWHERCNYYQTTIDALLAPATPGRTI